MGTLSPQWPPARGPLGLLSWKGHSMEAQPTRGVHSRQASKEVLRALEPGGKADRRVQATAPSYWSFSGQEGWLE